MLAANAAQTDKNTRQIAEQEQRLARLQQADAARLTFEKGWDMFKDAGLDFVNGLVTPKPRQR